MMKRCALFLAVMLMQLLPMSPSRVEASRMEKRADRVALWHLPDSLATGDLSSSLPDSRRHVRRVRLTPYLADQRNTRYPGVAVIVCPGGSYSWLDRAVEGQGVAEWLQSQGITAFVLEYRTQGVGSFLTHYRLLARGVRYPDASDDLAQAIRYVRQQASRYGIRLDKLGVMGFSAGGHLVMSSAAYCTEAHLVPDFIVPVYPVVTLREEAYVHRRSRRALLGEYRKHSSRWRDSLSLELHVPSEGCPPVMLVNCVDDPIVHYRNSVLLDSALTASRVPHQYHQYRTGGHGFGASPEHASEECIVWRDAFLRWLDSLLGHRDAR